MSRLRFSVSLLFFWYGPYVLIRCVYVHDSCFVILEDIINLS